MTFSVPDFNTPKQHFKFSNLSMILSSDDDEPSSSPLSSSMATLDLRNSYIRIPGLLPALPISSATLCCNLAVEIMNADPKNKHPSHPDRTRLGSDQQYTIPYSKIMSSSELTFLIAYSTPRNPLNPFSFDSIETRSSNRRDSGRIRVSISALFSSSNPTASLPHPEIAWITCSNPDRVSV